jgi:hypothetical protein
LVRFLQKQAHSQIRQTTSVHPQSLEDGNFGNISCI